MVTKQTEQQSLPVNISITLCMFWPKEGAAGNSTILWINYFIWKLAREASTAPPQASFQVRSRAARGEKEDWTGWSVKEKLSRYDSSQTTKKPIVTFYCICKIWHFLSICHNLISIWCEWWNQHSNSCWKVACSSDTEADRMHFKHGKRAAFTVMPRQTDSFYVDRNIFYVCIQGQFDKKAPMMWNLL